MQISKEIAGFSGAEGRRPAQGDRQEEARGDGRAEARVRRGLQGIGNQTDVIDYRWQTNEKIGRLLVQQEPRRLLRADRVPHRVPEGQLSGASTSAALISSVMSTKDRVPFFAAAARRWT